MCQKLNISQRAVVDCFNICSTILRSSADLLPSYVILHEGLAFQSMFLNIQRSGVFTVLTWLMPHENAAILACSVYTM